MAYNPFNIFRRNQKAIFAVVTVFIMFTFVLSSGLGGGADFFDWLPRWLGSKSKKGDVMCTLDGSKVTSSELEKLRYQRVIANRYMSLGAANTEAALNNYVTENVEQMSPEARQVMSRVIQQEQLLAMSPQVLMQFGMSHATVINEMRTSSLRILNLPGGRPQDKELARVKLVAISLLQSSMANAGEQQYFNKAPNRSNRDLVSFLIWQKKADQLGISFTQEDVKKLIDKEFYDYFRADAQVRVQKDLAKNLTGFNMNKCLDAIGEEFRVRAAQTAVLGSAVHDNRSDKTFGGFPSFNPPYEVFDYYRDRCSPTNYGAIPVPAINYLSKIADPDENDPKIRAELLELYSKHQNEEPNFTKETPGFKESRKVRVDWIALTGTEPYYVKEAEEKLRQEVLFAQFRSVMVGPFMGLSPAAIHNSRAFAEDPILAREYEFTVLGHKFEVSNRYSSANIFFSQLLSTSVVRPGVMASAAGAAAGQALAFGNPLAALVETVSAPMAYETRDRVQVGVPAVLLALGSVPGVGIDIFGTYIGKPVPGPLPGPALFANILGAAAAYELTLPKALPLDAVRAELTKKAFADKAKELAKKDLDTFIKDVKKLSDDGKVRPSEKDKIAAIQKYINEFTTKRGPRFFMGFGFDIGQKFYNESAAERGIKVGGNKVALSEWVFEEDPDLATLVTLQKDSLRSASNPHNNQYIPFANSFFWQDGNRRNPVSTTFLPADYPPRMRAEADVPSFDAKPQYVVWRAEEVPSKAPAGYDAAKPAVKAAWKRIKAREMAKARAEALAVTIRADQGADVVLPFTLADKGAAFAEEFAGDPKAKNRIVPFIIEGVCPLTTSANPTAGKGLFSAPAMPFAQLRPFQLPPSENVKYPSMPMLVDLLEKRTLLPKSSFVVADEPKDIYYVVTLMDRKPKSELEFQTAVYSEDQFTRSSGVRDAVLGNHAQDAQQKTIQSIMGLLKKEFKYEETDEQKKNLDERRGSDQ